MPGIRFIVEVARTLRPSILMARASASSPPHVVEALRARHVPRMWERMLTAAIKAGAVRADIDAPFVARLVLVTMQALLQPENLERVDAPPHEVMGRFFNLIFAGLLTKAGHTDYANHRAAFERRFPVR